MRYRLTIAYDGTQFHGWQAQLPPNRAPLRTVQGVMRDALMRTLRQPVEVVGASRTDSGVHAQGQVVHFDAETTIPIERLAMAVNSRLPDDVAVRRAEMVDDRFDAISDAVSKQYRYRLWHHTDRPVDRRHFVHHCWASLDVDRMNDAAARLVGTHDFAGMANADHDRQTTVRTIHDCRAAHDASGGPEAHIVVAGDGFLYNMVRIIAGTLVDVGRGHREPAIVDDILSRCDRTLAGATLPARGLCLEWIRYPDQADGPAGADAS